MTTTSSNLFVNVDHLPAKSSSNISPTFNIADILSSDYVNPIRISESIKFVLATDDHDGTNLKTDNLNSVDLSELISTVNSAAYNYSESTASSDKGSNCAKSSQINSSNDFDSTQNAFNSPTPFKPTKSHNSYSPVHSKDASIQTDSTLTIEFPTPPQSSNRANHDDGGDDDAASLECLIDAARCVCAQIKIEQAEKILNDLIGKFANSNDLSTTFDNIRHHESSLFCTTGGGDVETDRPLCFSPVFKLLLTLPQTSIFPDLCRTSTPMARKLNDLSNQLIGAIRRAKTKLRILQKMRTRQKPTPILDNDTINAKSHHSNKHLLTLATETAGDGDRLESQQARRDAFIKYLHEIQTIPDLHKQLSHYSSSSLPLLPNPPSQLASAGKTKNPSAYSNPMNCPLSMLSFVTSLDGSERSNERGHIVKSLELGKLAADAAAVVDDEDELRNFNLSDSILLSESPQSFNLSPLSPSISPSSCSTASHGKKSKRRQYSGCTDTMSDIGDLFGASPSKAKRNSLKASSIKALSNVACRIKHDETAVHLDDEQPIDRQSVLKSTRFLSSSHNTNNSSCSRSFTINSHNSSTSNTTHMLPSEFCRLNDAHTFKQLRVQIIPHEDEVICLKQGNDYATAESFPNSVPITPASISNLLHLYPNSNSSKPDDDDDLNSQTMSTFDTACVPNIVPFVDVPNVPSNRPPTPDIRRSELDLTDLVSETRVLIIQDIYLRAGVLYAEQDTLSTPVTNFVSPTHLKDHVFRIRLDNDLLDKGRHHDHRLGNKTKQDSSTGFSHDELKHQSAVVSNKIRQTDLFLHGWQVIQQAVLEVFPTSIRHVPPGTRVCATWSEQLALNLYPGTVVQVDPGEHISENCVAVDFDDGDHLQLPIYKLRILPEYFTNLCEMRHLTGENNTANLSACFAIKSQMRSRMRRHSDMDGVRSDVSSRSSFDFLSKFDSSVLDNLSTATNNKVLKFKHGSNESLTSEEDPTTMSIDGSSLCSTLVNSHDPVSTIASIDELHRETNASSPTRSVSLNDELLTQSHSNGNSAMDSTPKGIKRKAHCDIEKVQHVYHLNNLTNYYVNWKIIDKFKRRKQGMVCCRSIVRQPDGLVVSIGDCVQFSSLHEDLYLSKVREIRLDLKNNAIIITALWYYLPDEAGADGQLVRHIKGALFLSDHQDQNEVNCINRRVRIANSYKLFGKQTHSLTKTTFPLDQAIIPNTTNLPTSNAQAQTSLSNSEQEQPADFHYFVAGKYDPIHKRVVHWDSDLAQMLHLKIRSKPSFSTNK